MMDGHFWNTPNTLNSICKSIRKGNYTRNYTHNYTPSYLMISETMKEQIFIFNFATIWRRTGANGFRYKQAWRGLNRSYTTWPLKQSANGEPETFVTLQQLECRSTWRLTREHLKRKEGGTWAQDWQKSRLGLETAAGFFLLCSGHCYIFFAKRTEKT